MALRARPPPSPPLPRRRRRRGTPGGVAAALLVTAPRCGVGLSRLFEARDLPDFDCLGLPVAEEAISIFGSLTERDMVLDDVHGVLTALFAHEAYRWFRFECPIGAFVTEAIRGVLCGIEHGAACEDKGADVSMALDAVGWDAYGLSTADLLPVFLNSRWSEVFCSTMVPMQDYSLEVPDFFEAHNSEVRAVVDSALGCQRCDASGSSVAWCFTRDALRTDARYSTPGWMEGLSKPLDGQFELCPLGVLSMYVFRFSFLQVSSKEMVGSTARNVGLILDKGLPHIVGNMHESGVDISLSDVLFFTEWPLLRSVCQARHAPQRGGREQMKRYALDFWPEEIVRPATRPAERELAPEKDYVVMDRLKERLRGDLSPPMRQIVRALVSSLSITRGTLERRVVLATIVWGARLSVYIKGWLRRVGAFEYATRALMFCLDDASLSACKASHPIPDLCISGQQRNVFSKFAFVSAVLQAGFDVFFLDFDTVLMRDPMPHVLARARTVDMLVGRDFGTDCLNVGIFYLKAHVDVVNFIETLLLWMWQYPHDNDQRAFMAMLKVVDLQSEECDKVPLRIPQWGYLDPLNSFVTSIVYFSDLEGWTGDLSGILVYHFLDGTGGVDERAILGRYLNQFQLFYNNTALDLGDASRPLWLQDHRVLDRLQASRHDDPPRALRSCEILEPSLMPPWKRRAHFARDRRRALHAARQRARDWRPV